MLGQGDWATRPAACMLWSLVIILSLMVLTAAVHDHHLRKRLCLWHDERLLVYGPDESECWLLAISRDIFTTFVLDVLGVVKNAEKLKIKFAAGAWDAKEQDELHEASMKTSKSHPGRPCRR